MMHGGGKSDFAIVAMKPANKAEPSAAERSAAEPTAAEPVEPGAGTKGNADQQSTCRTQSRVSVSQALEPIRQQARGARSAGKVISRVIPAKRPQVLGIVARTELCRNRGPKVRWPARLGSSGS